MRANHIFCLFLFLIIALPLVAQKMTVESMVSTPMDQTANLAENMYQDLNGDYGGLVKVRLAAPNATFEGWVLKQTPPGCWGILGVHGKGKHPLNRKSARLPPS